MEYERKAEEGTKSKRNRLHWLHVYARTVSLRSYSFLFFVFLFILPSIYNCESPCLSYCVAFDAMARTRARPKMEICATRSSNLVKVLYFFIYFFFKYTYLETCLRNKNDFLTSILFIYLTQKDMCG